MQSHLFQKQFNLLLKLAPRGLKRRLASLLSEEFTLKGPPRLLRKICLPHERDFLDRLSQCPLPSSLRGYRNLYDASRAQLLQDLWVLYLSKFKRNGSFIEVGSSDGITLSNTYLLERGFDWGGVCVEPNPSTFSILKQMRSATCVNAALYEGSLEAVEFCINEFSDLSKLRKLADTNGEHKHAQTVIKVPTISFSRLISLSCRLDIDYLSVDVEGYDLIALQGLLESGLKPKIISIEHNFTAIASDIREYAVSLGYLQIPMSWESWDCIFVSKDASADLPKAVRF